ncbi:hypothetical protein L6164_017411 [Bauhinia variegata]|uniref:Uncharacterized protein n=1 Tax=Bauhinia variegata TaxID=167791 RepID=A0ACB9N9C8_BAUVA|nr:hypothetical protein L6164_017411 [Bauhinia variegata]
MARFNTLLLLLLSFFLLSASLCSCFEGRKLLGVLEKKKAMKTAVPSSSDSLFLSSLQKGTVPASAPSKKGHAVVVYEKLIARHLISSVPSPGAGH